MVFNRILRRIRRKQILKSCHSVGEHLTIFGCPSLINPNNISLGDDVNINDGVIINACESEIQIGNLVTISSNAMILSASYNIQSFLYSDSEKRKHQYAKVVIGNNVWICAGAIILPNVSIADHVIIGAGSVVTHSVTESYVLVAGNPARIIKHFEKE